MMTICWKWLKSAKISVKICLNDFQLTKKIAKPGKMKNLTQKDTENNVSLRCGRKKERHRGG